jgi:hypothetical protein
MMDKSPLEVAQDRLYLARATRDNKIKASDKLTHEIAQMTDHIGDLEDIIDMLKKGKSSEG